MKLRSRTIGLTALLILLVSAAACHRTNAGESGKGVAILFTNDVLGEYAPCG